MPVITSRLEERAASYARDEADRLVTTMVAMNVVDLKYAGRMKDAIAAVIASAFVIAYSAGQQEVQRARW